MVLAISLVEAPLKSRVPGVSLLLGLAIGRRVFAALNRIELALAAAVVVAAAVGARLVTVLLTGSVAVVLLLAQVGVVRPALSQRGPRSRRRGRPALVAGPPRLHRARVAQGRRSRVVGRRGALGGRQDEVAKSGKNGPKKMDRAAFEKTLAGLQVELVHMLDWIRKSG